MKWELSEITESWHYIKSNPAMGGIDHITLETFAKEELLNCTLITEKLNHQTYIPLPYLQIEIPKENHEKRILGLPAIGDKIVQQAIKNKINHRINHVFKDTSYAYREHKGPQRAIHRINQIIKNEKFTWIVKCDVDNFFDTISHDKLLLLLKPYVQDAFLQQLILMFCKMGYINKNNTWKDRNQGVPQGSILSPLLSNLYLTPLDQRMKDLHIKYVRYADDFLIFAKTEEEAKVSFQQTQEYIEKKLLLKLNEGSYVKHISHGFKYLGIWINEEGNYIKADKVDKLKKNIFQAFKHESFPKKFNETIHGIKNYYATLIPHHLLFPIDEYIKTIYAEKVFQNKKLRSKPQFKKELQTIQFVTTEYDDNKRHLINKMVEQLLVDRKQKKVKTAEEAVKIRKREYEKKAALNNHFVIVGMGKSIGISKNEITIKNFGKVEKTFPAFQLKHITITSNAANISTKLIAFCAQNKIPIDVINTKGEPVAKIYDANLSNTYLWERQHFHIQDKNSIIVAKELLYAKINNQIKLLKYFTKYATKTEHDIKRDFPETLVKFNESLQKIEIFNYTDIEQNRMELMGIEGAVSQIYWSCVEKMIDEETDFTGRIRQGATDLVNSMLNFGYSILYRLVWTSVLQQGLNPGFSYLHKPQPGSGTLIFDLIEPFRQPVVDRAIISMINRKTKLEIYNGTLTQATIDNLIKAIDDRLGRYDTYLKERLNMYDIINKQTLQLVKYIEGDIKKFKPYEVSKW